ncbi:recombinase family protein [Nonomuraea sp. NPDC050786]|uniref:recombinase family protein n=1 Tax=Nonomuraea sp. NPDC050786 TaxID=3154840 RepID=UPI0033D6B611
MWTLTEQHQVDGPIVYGYLRLHRSTPERQAALTVTLAQYCDQHELQLCGIFTDRGGKSADDPAFAGLLDVLLLSGAYGVVLPTAHHLGGKHIATRRREQIDAVGARLLFVRGTFRTTASSAGRSVMALTGAVPRGRSESARRSP